MVQGSGWQHSEPYGSIIIPLYKIERRVGGAVDDPNTGARDDRPNFCDRSYGAEAEE
jgi:hypothetical protein